MFQRNFKTVVSKGEPVIKEEYFQDYNWAWTANPKEIRNIALKVNL